MKIELTQTPLLTPPQVGELASTLAAIHTRVLKIIERLQKDVDAKKAEVANRWKTLGIDMRDRARYAEKETAAVIREIQTNSRVELDRAFKEAGPAYGKLQAQRPYYDNPVKVLSRVGLGSPQRSAYLQQLEKAGPGELAHMAQVAVGTKNEPLAAAVLSLLDAMPTKERPVSPVALAGAMQLDEFLKVQEYFKIGEARLQGIVLAIRAWTQNKSTPIDTVALALMQREIDREVEDEVSAAALN